MGPIVSALASALSGVAASVAGLILNIGGIITGAFLWLSVNILNWVLSPNFISLSYTDPANNAFLDVGWSLTRDFANIIIVLALVVIGLGTALRLTGYQAQKALPILILIALLINFTPVICGVIVDAANILMTFFVGDGFAGGNSFINSANSQWSNIESMAGRGKLWDPIASGEAIAAAAGALALIIFNVYAGLIYLLFALLFMVRYVAIWVLVILSPLAFACYILPDTKSVFTQWWKQFIQWSFIGVVAAFFLYLGDHFLMVTQNPEFHSAASTLSEVGSAPGLSGIINNIMPFAVVVVFLTIGLMLTLSSSAAGASGAMNLAKKSAPNVGKWMGKKGLAFARDKTPAGVRRWAERQATAKKWGEGEKGVKGALKRAASDPLARVRRTMGGVVTGALNEKLDTDTAYKKAKEQGIATNTIAFNKATDAERVGIMKAMREKGKSTEFLKGLPEKEKLKTYEKAIRMGDEDTAEAMARGSFDQTGDFEKILNQIEPGKYNAKGLTTADIDRDYTSYADKLIKETATEDQIKDYQEKWYEKTDSQGTKMIEHVYKSPSFGAKQHAFAALHHGPGFENGYLKFGQDKGVDWHFETTAGRANAPHALNILSSTPMQSLGKGWTGLNAQEIKQRTLANNIIRESPVLTNAKIKGASLDKVFIKYSKLRNEVKNYQGRAPVEVKREMQDIRDGLEAAKNGLRTDPKELDRFEEIERIMKYNPKP
ncbi:MAG: hypothetical protein ISS83_01915 [Candidatus Pacebacteria bacterium]|nr:hypothetical protein [Candidatus Paceibacterota bacterium]